MNTVMVIDDDPELLDATCDVLRDEGCVVSAHLDAREALAHLRQAPAPCLILLDLIMPAMDGWNFRREQLRDPSLARIPVVAMTGARDEVVVDPPSVNGVLLKPVRVEDLLSIVERYRLQDPA